MPYSFSGMPEIKTDVSIIVPLYKSRIVVQDQIMRWIGDDSLSVEIIYVDDNCPQNSKEAVRQAWAGRSDRNKFQYRVLHNKTNKGFGGACNIGAYHAKGKHLIFLNADTTVTPNWISPVVNSLEIPKVGIVGNLQLKEGGNLHGTIDGAGSEWSWNEMTFMHIGRHIYNGTLLEKPFHYFDAPKDIMVRALREMVTGCCFGIRKELFDEIGGFNQHYRIGYWEDSELCMTVREGGYDIVFEPKSVVYHKLSHSGATEPTQNRYFFYQKWIASGRIDKLVAAPRPIMPTSVTNILVNRAGAHGDVLVAAAVCKPLKEKYPNAKLYFSTKCESVLKDHPFIDEIFLPEIQPRTHFQIVIDLDLAYERRPKTNILQAYADEAGVSVSDCELFFRCDPADKAYEAMHPVVIHAGKTAWVGRNWNTDGFSEISRRVKQIGIPVICVGSMSDAYVPCDVDLRGKISLYQLATVIKNSSLFIGIDSLPMHIAQAVKAKSVCFFGCIRPETRLIGDCVTPVCMTDLPCIGCHHRQPAPSTVTNTCEISTVQCEKVSVDWFWNSVEEKLCVKN